MKTKVLNQTDLKTTIRSQLVWSVAGQAVEGFWRGAWGGSEPRLTSPSISQIVSFFFTDKFKFFFCSCTARPLIYVDVSLHSIKKLKKSFLCVWSLCFHLPTLVSPSNTEPLHRSWRKVTMVKPWTVLGRFNAPQPDHRLETVVTTHTLGTSDLCVFVQGSESTFRTRGPSFNVQSGYYRIEANRF